jgi:hypothetical protein
MTTYCQHPTCPNEIKPSWNAGRPRRYCSNACRQAVYRWSKNGFEHVRLSRRYQAPLAVPANPDKNSR